MKHIKLYLLLILGVTMLATSCTEDEAAAPVISNLEIGTNNSHVGYLGTEIHVEASILAEAKTQSIRVLIHMEEEGEHEEETQSALADDHDHEWEYDSTYISVLYANVVNPEFHEHIDIPADIEEGEYHFHLYVTDLEGRQTVVEEELDIQAPSADESFPSISVSNAPTEGQIFTTGQEITISGTIADVQGLAGIFVGIVAESAALENGEVGPSSAITMLHTHDFDEPNEYSFSAGITVGDAEDKNITPNAVNWKSGNYYIVVKAPGIDGEVSFSEHYPIVISVEINNMKRKFTGWFVVLLFFITAACTGIEIDVDAPEIDMGQGNDFPQACDTVYRGENFVFHATLTDNVELGAYSIDLHNNFDHHTHSTDAIDCALDPIKSEVDPFLFIEEYEIPAGQTMYSAAVSIDVPDSIDTGDYHFMLRVTDAEGWQSYKGISIKILDRSSEK